MKADRIASVNEGKNLDRCSSGGRQSIQHSLLSTFLLFPVVSFGGCYSLLLLPLAAFAGTYQALITVCKRNKQGEKSLLVYEVRGRTMGRFQGALKLHLPSPHHNAQKENAGGEVAPDV